MTTTVLDQPSATATAPAGAGAARPRWRRLSVVVLLAATGLLYVWDLGASGWANEFYAAAVQAGSQSWKAMLFGSSDAANAITVDKTPGALWVMDISARLFGFNSWSLLVPQALEGVAAVAVLYAAVRRVAGHWTGILAGAISALTPAAALMFRFDNPDALLVLLLTVAAYSVLRAIEKDSAAWWLPLTGVAVGFGFLAKMMQAFIVVPIFAGVYLLAAQATWRRRLIRSGAAVCAVVVSAGWYPAVVAVWPASSRPYIGGSQHNSVFELALGYNGFGRLTGDEVGGLGNMNHDVGWARLFGAEMGGQIAWLIPAALILGGTGLWLTRHAPRTDPVRASLLLWLGWLLLTGGIFSFASGILHPYYTVALAPAIAGSVAVGVWQLWLRRNDLRATAVLSGTLVVTTVLACLLLARTSDWNPWLRPVVAVAGVGAAVLLLVVSRLPRALGAAVVAVGLAAGLVGPTAYAVATASTPHTGAIPSAGPSSGHFGGMPPAGTPGGQATTSGAAAHAGRPMGGLLGGITVRSNLSAALSDNAGAYTWVAAAVGSNSAAAYQLATGDPVMAVGGFNGTDPFPTLVQFQQYVAQHKIHYFVGGAGMGGMRGASSGGSHAASDIAAWVADNFPARTIDGVTMYDLTAPAE
ncbi:glycosyltransferase family 39 protein [Nocardia veterana]|uniref:Phospholipid carrier-dependent glycosyltransferase n=1 Tax=Nocardia veterana TaxID=132249 RepID=A0A7X6LZ18_9NOCA|nr:glycosyltransferase family 39 protein [Nocardia veterana]NKY87198.1 phospholipid carrier-dependent glycosyltransferase [Nocardia veterana]